uniref:Uncharacterized protein n=1 Tax=Strigamia maritima TaxID=126957 RepID=T1IQE9_STRMM
MNHELLHKARAATQLSCCQANMTYFQCQMGFTRNSPKKGRIGNNLRGDGMSRKDKFIESVNIKMSRKILVRKHTHALLILFTNKNIDDEKSNRERRVKSSKTTVDLPTNYKKMFVSYY